MDIIASIESTLGVVNAYSIASSSRRVSALIFGVFDLLNDLGIEYQKNPEGAIYSRAKIPIDAKAAGKYAIDAIWQDIDDLKGLEADANTAKNLGYVGKSIIHPNQINAVHKIFYPTQPEIKWAKKVVSAYDEAKKNKKGATRVEGKMIDEVHYKRAKSLLDSLI